MTKFFQKVCQFVITIASPKHPQSVTGLVSARMRVKGVKINMKTRLPHAPHLIRSLKKREMPTKNSARIRMMDRGRAELFRKVRLNAVK